MSKVIVIVGEGNLVRSDSEYWVLEILWHYHGSGRLEPKYVKYRTEGGHGLKPGHSKETSVKVVAIKRSRSRKWFVISDFYPNKNRGNNTECNNVWFRFWHLYCEDVQGSLISVFDLENYFDTDWNAMPLPPWPVKQMAASVGWQRWQTAASVSSGRFANAQRKARQPL
jgi:hypothetical protein